MLKIRGIWLCHMSRWDRYVLRPRIWVETPRSGLVPHIWPYIRHTPNGVTVKKIQAKQVTGTICQHQEAHFRAMHRHYNQCKHAHKLYETKVDMTEKAWQEESCKKAS